MADGSYVSSLIASKNRIAPLKIIDIVRLELAAAVLGIRLRIFIEKESGFEYEEVYHITDSEIVKAMISKQSYGFNTYAENRIGEIQRFSNENEWYWAPGQLNIADWITRGEKPSELNHDSIWQNGPQFLSTSVAQWPVKQETSFLREAVQLLV